jgi:hypothetical protein
MPSHRSKVAHKAPLRDRAKRPPVALQLISADLVTEDDIEAALLDFDPDEVLNSVVPMPPSIPAGSRKQIADAACVKFEYYEDLDIWLHSPNITLGGATPFERIVRGDSEAVLLALGIGTPQTATLSSRRDPGDAIGFAGAQCRADRKRSTTHHTIQR